MTFGSTEFGTARAGPIDIAKTIWRNKDGHQMTPAEQLILRGLHLMIRTTFSPNEPAAQAKHFAALQKDIGPWFTDYAAEMTEAERRRVADIRDGSM